MSTSVVPLSKYLPSPRIQDLFSRTVTVLTLSYVSYRGIQILQRQGISGLVRTLTGSIISIVRHVPLLDQAMDKKMDDALSELVEELAPITSDPKIILPSGIAAASSNDEQLEQVERMLRNAQSAMEKDARDNGFRNGFVFGGIYHPVSYHANTSSSVGSSLIQYLQSSITTIFLNTNQLYPTLFRTARKMEAEAVMMSVNLLKGYGLSSSSAVLPVTDSTNDPAPDSCGVLTSGGTESILVSMKTYRDCALKRLGYTEDIQDEHSVINGAQVTTLVSPIIQANKDGIVLQVLAGISCHPALDKACHLLGLQLIKIPVDPLTKALNPYDVEKLFSPSTLVIYASAPGFAHGIVDPVGLIGQVAERYTSSLVWGAEGIPIHVDNCLGGVYLSFAYEQQKEQEEQGGNVYRIPAFDFRASKQVQTISIDLHKYGNTPKGSSIVAFRSSTLRKNAYSAVVDFPGGYYTTPTIGGSRNGISGSLSWATLCYYGYTGYSRIARVTNDIHQHILTTITNQIPGLQIVGTPHACIIAFNSVLFSPYSLAARMQEKGWHLALLQNPPALHIVITERLNEEFIPNGDDSSATVAVSRRVVDQWLMDLKNCTEECINDPLHPKYLGKGTAGIYGAASILPGGEVKRILQRYCDVLYMVR